MSVLKKLKGTFQNAQQDIVDGLRALTSLDNPHRNERQLNIKSREISLDTGADLLQSFQTKWSSIQTETGESAKKAEEVTTLVTPLFKIWEKHAQSLTQLEEEVKTIPGVLTMLTQLHNLLDGLSQTFIAAEKELTILENICDEQEFQKRCFDEHKKLAAYKVKKETETERVKVDLAQQHAKRVVMLEAAKKKSLQERAEAFTSAFQNDLDFYRTHGHPGRIPTEFPKVTSLSDIDLDQDKKALDSFLGPSPTAETDSTTGRSNKKPGSLELSGEGAYIEDDYTADFSVKQDMDFQEDGVYTSASIISQLQIDDESDDISYAQTAVTSDLSHDTNNQNCEGGSAEKNKEGQDNVSTENMSTDNISTDNINKDNVDNISTDNMSRDNVSIDNMSTDNVSSDNMSKDNVSTDIISTDNVDNISTDNISTDNVDNISTDNIITSDSLQTA